jgi:two-component system NarL family sensor kinase
MRSQLQVPYTTVLARDDPSARRLADEPAESIQRLERLLSSDRTRPSLDELLKIHEYERRRLGQELHDSTGQLVVCLLLSLSRLRKIEEGYGHGTLIDEMQEIVTQIDKEIRSLAFLHCPAELADRCLFASVESLAVGFGRRTGMHISCKCLGDAGPVTEPVSIALLRVTQEALVNVHRHAHATSAKVELKQRFGRLELKISDDGIGMPRVGEMADSSGIGLQGMRYRVEALGGTFEIRNRNPGTVISAAVPLTA